ncbi:hypothetical protein EDD21DRAFT_363723 [Dissophora ornata]|nr:hypothetical protein EDD21DRAFT_363723 [Dissophora ornata]
MSVALLLVPVDRFAQLNKIARPVYPTFWPNAVMCIIFAGLFTAAAVGISKTGSSLAIMSQGSCFILPVIVVLWIRIRKEVKAKARKKFKQQSQTLLRTWTAQDYDTNAIQWKLRIRPKSEAQRWRRVSTVQDLPRDAMAAPNYTNAQSDIGDQPPQSSVVVLVEEHHEGEVSGHGQDDLIRREQPLQETSALSTSPIPPTTSPLPSSPSLLSSRPTLSPTPTIPAPRAVADVYSALRRPTTTTPAVISPQLLQAEQQQEPEQHYSQAGLSAAPDYESPEMSETAHTKWSPWMAYLRNLYCYASFFKEGKAWMIEISLREGVLDEYSVPVPSPAYCDYRLPGYEDVMINATTRSPLTTSGSPTTTSTIRVPSQPRYIGSPPAYESDSENDSDSEDDDNEEVQEEAVQDRNEGSQRPIEMTAVMVSSGPSGSRPSARLTTSSGQAVAADIGQDITTTSAGPLPSQPPSAVISGNALSSITWEDKNEGSSSTNKPM